MAVIQPGPIVTDILGKLGGVVFSHGVAGNTVRSWVMPTRSNSPLQATPRSAASQMARAWSTDLTALQRTAWETLGAATTFTDKFGDPFNPNGFNVFMFCNLSLIAHEESPVVVAPDFATNIAATKTIAFNPGGPGINILAGGTPSAPPGGALFVSASPALSIGKTFYSGPWRVILKTTVGISFGNTLNLIPPATIVLGARYFFKVTVANNGPAGGPPPNNMDGRIWDPQFVTEDAA